VTGAGLTAVAVLALAAQGTAASTADTAARPAPSEYVVAATRTPAATLLAGGEAAWKGAREVQWGPSPYETGFRALWAADALYLRFDARDAHPWHTMTKRDEHLWEEEVVEIFLDPGRAGHDYYELEVNPANVVCDVLMIQPSPDKKSDLGWNLAGLETAVVPWKDAKGTAQGWTALARLPFAGLRALPSATGVTLPPHSGDRWRFNLFRVERPGGKEHPEKDAIEAAWSPTGQPSFHVPAAFRDLVFAGGAASPHP
jgi:hypothetical protein